jgi:hypothetical protein
LKTLVIWLAVACSALSALLAIRNIRRGRRSPGGLSSEAVKLNAGMICCALIVVLTGLVSPRYPTIGNSPGHRLHPGIVLVLLQRIEDEIAAPHR